MEQCHSTTIIDVLSLCPGVTCATPVTAFFFPPTTEPNPIHPCLGV
jgi:hypothetical protein